MLVCEIFISYFSIITQIIRNVLQNIFRENTVKIMKLHFYEIPRISTEFLHYTKEQFRDRHSYDMHIYMYVSIM